MTNNAMSHHPDDPSPPAPVLRWMSNTMSLNGLCARAACRRAQACRGEPHDCLARYAPLVPEAAREGVKVMIDGLRLSLPFDDLLEEAKDELAALADWKALVKGNGGKQAKQTSPGRERSEIRG